MIQLEEKSVASEYSAIEKFVDGGLSMIKFLPESGGGGVGLSDFG